jgi:hypothetical protein
MQICVVNHSTKVTNEEVLTMTAAVSFQVRNQAAPAWSLVPPTVSYLQPDAPAPGLAVVIGILDDADQAGDLGWHTEGPGGSKLGRVFAAPVLANGGNALTDTLSVASVLSHEVLESMCDPACNRWCDAGSGTAYALEVADPVESDSYDIAVSSTASVSVSNFVLPAWFDPDAATGAPVDYLKLLQVPFQIRPTGYVVSMTDGTVNQTFGERYPEWRKATKLAGTARTARRLIEGHKG